MLRIAACAVAVHLAAGAAAEVLHVDTRAPAGGDGSSWGRAFNSLTDARASASPDDELWLAGGRYIPVAPAGRDATFTIPDGVRVLGGFRGNETDVADRPADPFDNPSQLQGGGVYSVVTMITAGAGTHLDGLIIEGGLADGATIGARQQGGGIFAVDSAPTLSRLIVRNNTANDLGGGIALTGSVAAFAQIEQVDLSSNTAGLGGGGLYVEVNATILDSDFRNNVATGAAGGARIGGGGVVTIADCSFTRNETTSAGGGAIAADMNLASSVLQIDDCLFRDNEALTGGGAIGFDGRGDHSVRNSRFFGNSADGVNAPGAGISIFMDLLTDRVTIENCLLSGNVAAGNGAVTGEVTVVNTTVVNNTSTLASNGGFIDLTGGDVVVANSIFWNNTSLDAPFSSFSSIAIGPLSIENSIIEFLDSLPFSIQNAANDSTGDDPLFVDIDGNDNTPGTTDDNVRLMPGSPAIDAGNNLFPSPFAVVDVYGVPRYADDTGTPDTGTGDFTNDVVDIGAAEFQGTTTCPADFAEPFGTLDIFDVLAYLAQFDAMDDVADLAAPFGSFDIFDVLAYLTLFADC